MKGWVYVISNKAMTGLVKRRVFKKVNVAAMAPNYPLELGWVFISEEYRDKGLSRLLVEPAINAADGTGVFATMRSGNKRMSSSLKSSGFKRTGTPYASDRGKHELEIYVLAATQ